MDWNLSFFKDSIQKGIEVRFTDAQDRRVPLLNVVFHRSCPRCGSWVAHLRRQRAQRCNFTGGATVTTKRDYAWWREHLEGVKASADGSLKARCPSHDDQQASLHIGPGLKKDGTPVVNDFGGCDYKDIILALDPDYRNGSGPTPPDKSHDDPQPVVQPRQAHRHPDVWLARKTGTSTEFLKDLPVTFEDGWVRYHYGDPLGVTQDRLADTKERKKDPAGVFCPVIWPVEEHMPEEGIFTEGQTDCIALRYLFRDETFGVYSLSGASNLPTVEEWKEMRQRGLRLAVIAFDADKAGRTGTDTMLSGALAAGLEVRIVRPPDYDALTNAGKDWCDWIAAGGTLDTFPWPDSVSGLLTISDLKDLMPLDYDWFVDPITFSTGVTIVVGLPKSGKTTFVVALAGTLGRGQEFLPTVQIKGHKKKVPLTKLIILSEQPGPPIADQHALAGLRDDTFYYTDTLMAQRGETVTDVLLKARAQALTWVAEGARVIVLLDSFEVWADVKDENDAPEVTKAVQKLRALFAVEGVATILIHHLRKGGGDRGEGVRGSGALVGACDVFVEFGETTGDDKRERALNIRGRLDRGRGPQYMKVRLDENTSRYALLQSGDGTATLNPRNTPNPMAEVADRNRDRVEQALPGTSMQLAETTGIGLRTVKTHLQSLLAAGRAHSVQVDGQPAPLWKPGSGVQSGSTT